MQVERQTVLNRQLKETISDRSCLSSIILRK